MECRENAAVISCSHSPNHHSKLEYFNTLDEAAKQECVHDVVDGTGADHVTLRGGGGGMVYEQATMHSCNILSSAHTHTQPTNQLHRLNQ